MTKRQLMRDFQRPTETEFNQEGDDRAFARFAAYPYERGFGTTIGNSLRRILISSIEGYAISAIRVTYIDEEGDGSSVLMSEFQSIAHVAEDTVEVIANLKHCAVSLNDNVDKDTFTFEVEGEGAVTAAIFQQYSNITVYNPEQVIMTTMSEAKISIEMQIERGVGYRTAEEGKKLLEVVDAIPLDALFSPVIHVALKIEKVRVGRRTDYDKMILEVRTNGSVRPQDAVAEAAKIAKEHFTLFINFNEDDVEIADYRNAYDDITTKALNTSIETLELSARASNCLAANGIGTLGELVSRSEQEIVEMRNFGKKSLEEIKDKLRNEWNLSLGMTDPDEIREALRAKSV